MSACHPERVQRAELLRVECRQSRRSKQKWLGAAKTGSIKRFCWLFTGKVTFSMTSQRNSLRDPASATPRTFACSLRSTRESSTRASPFAQDDIWTDVCLLSDVLTRYSRIRGIFGGGTPKICGSYLPSAYNLTNLFCYTSEQRTAPLYKPKTAECS